MKKRFARIMALSMAAVMTASLAACGGGGGDSSGDGDGGSGSDSDGKKEITIGISGLRAQIRMLSQKRWRNLIQRQNPDTR